MHELSDKTAHQIFERTQSCERGVVAVGVDYITGEPVHAIAVVGPDSLAFVTIMSIGTYEANLN